MDDKSNNLTALLLNAGRAARFLGIGRSQFYLLNSNGGLGPLPVRLGRRNLWRRLELQAWVAKGCPNRERWVESGSENK